MKTIPMIFNTEMVKALLDGRKTVTRRPIKDRYFRKLEAEILIKGIGSYQNIRTKDIGLISGFEVGDLIWVRETFCYSTNEDGSTIDSNGNPCISRDSELFYRASPINGLDATWIPSIHMPKSANRLTLRVTDVRIEQVQDITEEQAKAEGSDRNVWFMPNGSDEGDWINFDGMLHSTFKTGFANIWESIYSNWNENPYVWVIEFEVIHKNVDEVGK